MQCGPLIPPALALGRGEVPQIPRLNVREADDVARAIDRAFHLLQSRTTGTRQCAGGEAAGRDFSRAKWPSPSSRLKFANRELEQFAYAASHDLKAPLRVIDNASQWLEEVWQDNLTEKPREHEPAPRPCPPHGEPAGRFAGVFPDRAGEDEQSGEVVTGAAHMDNVVALLPPPADFVGESRARFADIHVPDAASANPQQSRRQCGQAS